MITIGDIKKTSDGQSIQSRSTIAVTKKMDCILKYSDDWVRNNEKLLTRNNESKM